MFYLRLCRWSLHAIVQTTIENSNDSEFNLNIYIEVDKSYFELISLSGQKLQKLKDLILDPSNTASSITIAS